MTRSARPDDLDALVALASAKRTQYAPWQPVFHRPADDADAAQRNYLADAMAKADCRILVDEADGKVQAFLFARLVSAPPVYAPGGKVVLVDDFCVANDRLWESSGSALLNDAWDWGKTGGAVLLNVVCGPNDEAKRTLLARLGLSVASEWHVGALD
jgi:hypothetical protein